MRKNGASPRGDREGGKRALRSSCLLLFFFFSPPRVNAGAIREYGYIRARCVFVARVWARVGSARVWPLSRIYIDESLGINPREVSSLPETCLKGSRTQRTETEREQAAGCRAFGR